jgi:outer membrane protein assembly factor BamB
MKQSLRFILILLPSVLLAGCGTMLDPTTWFESDNQEPPAELTDYEPTLSIRTLWSRDTGAGSADQELRLVPAYHQGRIFVADSEGQVQALDVGSGEPVWTVQTETPISGGPGVGNGKVMFGTRKAEIIALREEDGSELWRTRVSSEVLSVPQAAEGTVVVHTVDGRLYGLSTDSGEHKWTYDRSEPVLTLRGSSSPVIDRSNVITGFSNGVLVSLTLATGEPRWEVVVTPPHGRSELERIVDIDTDPVVRDGMVYVGSYQGDVAGIGQDTGVVLWRRRMSSYAGMAADWRRLYVTDASSRVWALDEQNGSALWKQEKLLHRRLTAPVLLGDYVLVGDLEGYVHWLSYDDGSQKARVRVSSSPISIAPQVVDEVAYVYADDGTLAALAPSPTESQ